MRGVRRGWKHRFRSALMPPCLCCRETMAPYTIPTELIVVEEIPRNQMGKVNKKELLQRFYPA